MILALASLTPLFSQKSGSDADITPYINSKYQETMFNICFHGTEEDIGNTSYDASVMIQHPDGTIKKYLVGIKTFGYKSNSQKVAQFKAMQNDWSVYTAAASRNAVGIASRNAVDAVNTDVYMSLAKNIAEIRNDRINSSTAQLRGFRLNAGDDVESVYHVLMPSKEHGPQIHVGETSYLPIDIDNIRILGCTDPKNPANFQFTDGVHIYKFTSADMQLYMDFNNTDIVQETWDVKYVSRSNAVRRMSGLYENVYEDTETAVPSVPEQQYAVSNSVCWKLTNKNGEVERYSGFNSFYGTGSKASADQRRHKIAEIKRKYSNLSSSITVELESFLLDDHMNKTEKESLRNEILNEVKQYNNSEMEADFVKAMFRPMNEMYIPIPNAREFHRQHPGFFGHTLMFSASRSSTITTPKAGRAFHLVFEPSGDAVNAYITQDNGKAIESYEKQTALGEWILRGIFQLPPYQPLTADTLARIGINAVRLYKLQGGKDVHLEFIEIDDDHLPPDYWQ